MEQFINNSMKYISLIFSGLYIFYAVNMFSVDKVLFMLDVFIAVCFFAMFILLLTAKSD